MRICILGLDVRGFVEQGLCDPGPAKEWQPYRGLCYVNFAALIRNVMKVAPD